MTGPCMWYISVESKQIVSFGNTYARSLHVNVIIAFQWYVYHFANEKLAEIKCHKVLSFGDIPIQRVQISTFKLKLSDKLWS